MKSLIPVITLLLFLILIPKNIAKAQDAFAALISVQTSACFSDGGCEVVTRQYTGLYQMYVINIRCMNSSGNFGDWQSWTYEGVNNGSYCN